jgi:hypothetical protein
MQRTAGKLWTTALLLALVAASAAAQESEDGTGGDTFASMCGYSTGCGDPYHFMMSTGGGDKMMHAQGG